MADYSTFLLMTLCSKYIAGLYNKVFKNQTCCYFSIKHATHLNKPTFLRLCLGNKEHFSCLFGLFANVFLLPSPAYKKVVTGEGMPLSQDPSLRGNLILTFNIQFPVKLSAERKQLIKQALANNKLMMT